MASFEEICNEVVVLSDAVYRQQFRACFVEHLQAKVETLIQVISNEHVDVNILKSLQLKLFEPIMFHLRKPMKSTDKCLLIRYLIVVLGVTSITEVNIFFHLYSLLFSHLLSNCENNSNVHICEELKMIVLEAGSYLIKTLKRSTLEKVFTQESAEKLSIGILISVRAAKEERNIRLRLEALNFLLTATQFKENVNYRKGIHKNLGELFMLYLPGVMAPLQEIVLRDETQHHLITVKALVCWGHIICLVLCDLVKNKQLTENESMKQWMETCDKFCNSRQVIDTSKELASKTRTKTWQLAAGNVLKPLIIKITEVRKHSNAKCRLELTKSVIKVLEHCSDNLESSLSPMVEIIVGSVCDENDEVCEIAEEALKKFEAQDNAKYKTFISVVESNFYLLLNRLLGIIQSDNEKAILPSLKSFTGYLQILGRTGKLHQLMSLSSILKKLLFVVEVSFELQLYPEISNQGFSVYDNEKNTFVGSKRWKQFRHHTENSIRIELERICQVIGEYTDAETVVDCLLESYLSEPSLRKEILITLNQIILGLQKISNHLVNHLLEFYLNEENLYLILQVDNEDCPSLKDANSNIVKVALVMEGLGNLAKKLGSRFQNCLLKSLYYVVEQMGSSYHLINVEATKTAIAISTACGYEGSIELLIRENLDYLTYHSVTKLKRNYSGVFDVMRVLIKHSDIDTVRNLEEIMSNVLKTSSRNLSSHLTISYLRLFQTFVLCVRKQIGKPKVESDKSVFFHESLIQELIGRVQRKNALTHDSEEKVIDAAGDETEETEDNESECNLKDTPRVPEVDENPEKVVPKHIALTVAIASHCLNFMASKDKSKKLVVLEILNESVLILSEWEDELLPVVHKIWSPLTTRFEQMSDPLLIKSSFNLLCTLARTSKHFIRSRTLKAILPSLQCFLLRQADKSKLKDSASGYHFTQNYKLQCTLLENLGSLATDLTLFEKQTDLIVECSLPYLSSKQPKQLQENCRNLFLHLKGHDPYLIWFKLQGLTNNPEFSNNVKLILQS